VLKRFLQTDPSGQDGQFSYAYVGDDPVDGSDPTGLYTQGQQSCLPDDRGYSCYTWDSKDNAWVFYQGYFGGQQPDTAYVPQDGMYYDGSTYTGVSVTTSDSRGVQINVSSQDLAAAASTGYTYDFAGASVDGSAPRSFDTDIPLGPQNGVSEGDSEVVCVRNSGATGCTESTKVAGYGSAPWYPLNTAGVPGGTMGTAIPVVLPQQPFDAVFGEPGHPAEIEPRGMSKCDSIGLVLTALGFVPDTAIPIRAAQLVKWGLALGGLGTFAVCR